MNSVTIQILLADDDKDDCLLFKDALDELPISVELTTVHSGEQLMRLFGKMQELPDMLFLDLNMPRKNGFECLTEIKENGKLKELPVIIFSTSFDQDIVNLLYTNGAHYCIRKPNQFSRLKKLLHRAITLTSQALPIDAAGNLVQPSREDFVIL
jgi:CheY-like chemotaxis protein